MTKHAVIIIPTYNEIGNIKEIIFAIKSQIELCKGWKVSLLIVDSSSPDGTASTVKEIQKNNDFIYLIETKKEGLGKAYINGFHYALEKLKADVVFEMDADFSHNPKHIPEFLEQIDKGNSFIIGARYIKGGSIPADWGFDRKFFSVLGNLIIRFGFMKLQITDWTSGYRAIKSDIVRNCLPLLDKYSGYVFQVAILDNAIKQKAKIKEIPINFVDRKEGVSKINSFQYTTQTLFYVFSHSPFIRFVLVGGSGFLLDMSLVYTFTHILFHISSSNATMISASTTALYNFLLNNFWSFSHKKADSEKKVFAKMIIKYAMVSCGNILIQWSGVKILEMYFGLAFVKQYILIIKICIITLFVIPYSYFFYNRFVWKDKK